MIASLQRQIVSLEGVMNTLCRELAESRGEPAPAWSLATAAAPAVTTTTTTSKTVTANKKAAPTSGPAPVWQLVGMDSNRRQEPLGATSCGRALAPHPPPTPPRPPACGPQTAAEHHNGCICRSGHLPVHPFVSSQPGSAQKDIKVAQGNIVLWGVGGVEEGSAPPPPPCRLALAA